MRNRRRASIAANPVLVGAVTVLVVVVAVFLAYNANNGLPFVPTRELKVNLNTAAQLVKGADVREGGTRIGVVSSINPVILRDGRAGAQAIMRLNPSQGKLPVDSTVTIRPRSVLGLMYVDVHRGTARRVFADGATMPARQASVGVRIEDVFSMFDRPTRRAAQENLNGFGDVFAGRGVDINLTIQALPSLLAHLTPVARNLSAPETNIRGFLRGLQRASTAVAPVAQTNARLFSDAATTFQAMSADTRALQDTISKSPPTLAVGTRSLAVQRPFLADTAAFATDLNGAVSSLRAALPEINPALEEGAPVLRRSVSLDARLEGTMRALRDLAQAPSTNLALQGLTTTVTTLNPMLRFLGPQVTVCNYFNYFFTYLGEHMSEADQFGYAQRALLNTAGAQTDSVNPTLAVATHPANGQGYNSVSPLGDVQYLHGQPYGAAIDNNGNADCEQGQRGYPQGRWTSSLMPSEFRIVTNAHDPGNQGPTYTGLPRVPKGETFQREPNVNRLNEDGSAIVP